MPDFMQLQLYWHKIILLRAAIRGFVRNLENSMLKHRSLTGKLPNCLLNFSKKDKKVITTIFSISTKIPPEFYIPELNHLLKK